MEESNGGHDERLMLLVDSAYGLVPLQVSHREAFREAEGWLASPGRLERLVRRYDASGAWISATWSSADLDYPHDKGQQGKRLPKARYNLLQLTSLFVAPMADSAPRFGFVAFAETWNGRLAMLGFVIGLATEVLTGQSILSQIGLG